MLLPDGGGRESGSAASNRVGWRAGELEIDTTHSRVTCRGMPVQLDFRQYALLLHLVEHGGSVASKEDLLCIGWPNRVVSENSLNKAISKLRHVLGSEHGELIRVVHGYGYRLVATPEPLLAKPADSEPAMAAPASARSAIRDARSLIRFYAGWPVAGLLVLALLSGWMLLSGRVDGSRSESGAVPMNEDVIAVLPFRDASNNGSLGVLADGIGNHLRDQLQRVPALRIISRARSYEHRGDATNPEAIARELGANLIVSGEVALDGDQLRVAFSVYDARVDEGGEVMTLTRSPQDQATLLEDLTGALFASIGDQPDRWGYDAASGRGTANVEAYQTFLSAATLFSGNNDPNSHRRAMAVLGQAIALDPNYADALLMLGGLYGGSGYYADSVEELVTGRKRALELMTRGMALVPDDPANFLLRSEMRLLYFFDWQGAQDDIDAARARTPGGESAMLLIWMARYSASLGRIDEAIALDARANALDPQAGGRRNQGWHYLAKGDTRKARAVLMLQLEDLPENPHTNFYLALCDILEGDPNSALPRLEHSSTLFRLVGTVIAQHELGDRAASDRALTKLKGQFAIADGYWVGAAYAWRGEFDLAIQWIERAMEGGDSSVMYLTFDPLLHRLRSDPRYPGLIERLNLPE